MFSITTNLEEQRRLHREKGVEEHITIYKLGMSDNNLSIEQIIMTLQNYFVSKKQESSSQQQDRVLDYEFNTAFANIYEGYLESICKGEYDLGIGDRLNEVISEKMPHHIKKVTESFFPYFFLDHLPYADVDDLFAQMDFLELVYLEFVSPCEEELCGEYLNLIKESGASRLIDDAIMNNNSGATFVNVVNLACENAISLFDEKVSKTIFKYFKNFYEQELSQKVQEGDEEMKADILYALEISTIVIVDCIRSELDSFFSIALVDAVMTMYFDYERQIEQHKNLDCLADDFTSMGI